MENEGFVEIDAVACGPTTVKRHSFFIIQFRPESIFLDSELKVVFEIWQLIVSAVDDPERKV